MLYFLYFLFLFLFIFAQQIGWTAVVSNIRNTRTLAISPEPQCNAGNTYALYSQDEENTILGFGNAVGNDGEQCVLKVQTHSQTGMIRIGDPAKKLDLTTFNPEIKGRHDLVIEGKKEYSSRYKPLVHMGQVYGQSAATLDKGEFLLGLAQAIYGITNHWQVDTYPGLHFVGISALGMKYKLYHTENIRISPHAQVFRFTRFGKSAYDFSLNFDSQSNSQSATHSRLSFISKRPVDGLPLKSNDEEKQYTTEFTSLYEWILPSWDRILFGPKFSRGAESELGFVFTMVFIYDSFHWSAGIDANSLTSIDFAKKKQVLNLDLFWRF